MDINIDNIIHEQHERLKEIVAKMTLNNKLWGYIFSLIHRKPMITLHSPMGVGALKSGKIELAFNPIMLQGIIDDEIICKILEHEALHLINQHLTRYIRYIASPDGPQNQRSVFNVAADFCCNQQIKDMPRKFKIGKTDFIGKIDFTACFPDMYNLPKDLTMEQYYELLQKQTCPECGSLMPNSCGEKNPSGDQSNGDASENQNSDGEKNSSGDQSDEDTSENQNSSGGKNSSGDQSDEDRCSHCGAQKNSMNIDDHSLWEEALKGEDPQSVSRKIDGTIRSILKKAVKEYTKRQGTLHANLKELLDEALRPPKVPYYQIIQKIVRGTMIGAFKRHFTKFNRKRSFIMNHPNESIRMVSPFPGRAFDKTYHLGIMIDTSGSISPDDMLEALSGIKNFIENDRHIKCTVLEVDTQVNKEYECKRVSDIQYDILGRGGTVLKPGLDRAKELDLDLLISFTDGYCENINNFSKSELPPKILWIISEDGTDEYINGTGWVIHL